MASSKPKAKSSSSKKATKPTKQVKSTTKATSKKHPVAHSASSKKSEMRSFQVSEQKEPFFSVRITTQTIYWAILSILVLSLGLWINDINDRVQAIYDQVDAMNRSADEVDSTIKSKPSTTIEPAEHQAN